MPVDRKFVAELRQHIKRQKDALTRVEMALDDAGALSMEILQERYQDYQQAVCSMETIVKQAFDDAMKTISNVRTP